ncbi:MAG: uroporphyrinogen decarboxylase family protein [Armatimonadota bacterium]
MTGRERLLAVLNHQPVDRVPVSPFIHVNYVKAFYQSQDIDIIPATVDVYDEFRFDLIHRNCTPAYDDIGLTGDDWQPEKTVEPNGSDQTTYTVIHTPGGDLHETHRIIWVSEYDAEASPVQYVIKSEDDFNLLEKFQPPVSVIDTAPIVRAKNVVGEKGLIAPWVQGAFNYISIFYRRLDDLVMDAMLSPDFYHRMMEYFLHRNMAVVSQYIDAGADILSYAGNTASGKIVGESFFREFILPYEKRLIDFIQDRGAYVLYHNCGYAKALFPCYRDMGMRAYESLTAPPYGDTILNEAFEAIGPQTVLHGGMDQIEFLRTASVDDIRATVKEVLDIGKAHGNFILGTSDYFNEDTPYEKIAAMADASIEYGRYNP